MCIFRETAPPNPTLPFLSYTPTPTPPLSHWSCLRNFVEMMEGIEYWWQSWRGKYYSRINGISASCSGIFWFSCLSWCTPWLHSYASYPATPIHLEPAPRGTFDLTTEWDPRWCCFRCYLLLCYGQTSIYSWVDSTTKFLLIFCSLILLPRKLTWFAKIPRVLWITINKGESLLLWLMLLQEHFPYVILLITARRRRRISKGIKWNSVGGTVHW